MHATACEQKPKWAVDSTGYPKLGFQYMYVYYGRICFGCGLADKLE